jgi:para-nitrobenzyl esterase
MHPNFVALLLLTALGLASCSNGNSDAPTQQWQGSELVHASAGDTQGIAANDAVWTWLGIPFAQPPVGNLRWQAPRKMSAWPGVRIADTLGMRCPQHSVDGAGMLGDEDCLTLNIWRPRNQDINLPVYIWIHGGGNSAGDALEHPEYNGANFAEHANAVFVSINYRLGPLGWFAHSSLQTGDAATDSGNFGTLDIIAALQWVQDNISAFGGNADNVTVHGQSAGGINVISLLLSPPAHGLFHQAIVQSGMRSVTSMAQARVQTESAMRRLLIADGSAADDASAALYLDSLAPDDIAAYLRRQTPAALFEVFPIMAAGMLNMGTVFADGAVIVDDALNAFVTGNYPNKVPVILGSTEDEARVFVALAPGVASRDDLFDVAADYSSDLWKASAVDSLARQLRSHADQPPVYVYQFQWGAWREDGSSPIPAPFAFRLGATHNVDTPFFFRNDTVLGNTLTPLLFTADNLAGRQALSEAISDYTARFARRGNPNSDNQQEPQWRAWSNEAGDSKQLLLNVDGDATAIRMSATELYTDDILSALQAEVPPPLANEALDVIENSVVLCSLLKAEGSLADCE